MFFPKWYVVNLIILLGIVLAMNVLLLPFFEIRPTFLIVYWFGTIIFVAFWAWRHGPPRWMQH